MGSLISGENGHFLSSLSEQAIKAGFYAWNGVSYSTKRLLLASLSGMLATPLSVTAFLSYSPI